MPKSARPVHGACTGRARACTAHARACMHARACTGVHGRARPLVFLSPKLHAPCTPPGFPTPQRFSYPLVFLPPSGLTIPGRARPVHAPCTPRARPAHAPLTPRSCAAHAPLMRRSRPLMFEHTDASLNAERVLLL